MTECIVDENSSRQKALISSRRSRSRSKLSADATGGTFEECSNESLSDPLILAQPGPTQTIASLRMARSIRKAAVTPYDTWRDRDTEIDQELKSVSV